MSLLNEPTFIAVASRVHTALYRVLGGAGVTGHYGRAPVLLLSTVGRRTGRRRTTPMIFARDGDAFVMIASNGGAARHPGWWHNLRAQPEARVQVGREIISVRAEDASPADRARLWNALTELYPSFDRYARKTSRLIPVVILRRRSS